VHIFGWSSERARKTLKSQDETILNAATNIKPDSLFIAFGDHGATRGGCHGGATKEELESGMFAYSQKKFTFRTFKYPENLPRKEQELIKILDSSINHDFLNRDTFPQIDNVPTISAILNTPIPYSSLGIIIPELLHYDNCHVVGCLYELFMEHILNFAQILNYAETFSKTKDLLTEHSESLKKYFNEIKPKVLEIMKRSKEIIKTEHEYVINSENNLSDEYKQNYKQIVENMFEIMKEIRSRAQNNSKTFKSLWYSINEFLLYQNIGIRVFCTFMIATAILILFISIQNNLPNIFYTQNTTIYAGLGLVAFFAVVLITNKFVYLSLFAIYGVTLLSAGLFTKLLYKYKKDIVALFNNENYKFPTIISIALILIEALVYAVNIFVHFAAVYYFAYTLLAIFVLVVVCKKPENLHIVGYAVLLALFCRAMIAFPSFKIDTNYTICSIIPSIILFGGCLFYMKYRTPSGVNQFTKFLFIMLFAASFIGMIYYQVGEIQGFYKETFFCHIVLPRTIFLLCALQFLFILVSLCWKSLLWSSETPKSDRIFTTILFIMSAMLPSLLMMVGAYQQIYFLALYIYAASLYYILDKIGLANSMFHYTFYAIFLQCIYHTTGHNMDFMALKIQRAFVGFPEFKTEINFSLAFFETVGTISFMLALIPLTSKSKSPNILARDYKECVQSDMEPVPSIANGASMQIELKLTPVGIGFIQRNEEWIAETVIMRNFLIVLFIYDMVHNGLTWYLTHNFSGKFFMASPTEFTFRFIDAYVYILTFIYGYIIGAA